eukprot:TRINITY_DN2199_c0_g1_i1.p1 TRINITY_DN2199_c0_g1~~TRINITY_DN2199_c0_g1_i1.p1  ORF type:complete len:637 (-),score=100.40 TRINITY_DN2199_c0_g1_i1:45-1955(-)
MPMGDAKCNLCSGTIRTLGNILWIPFFGWWISLVYFVVALLLYATVICAPYGRLCWRLASYYIWPFGKYIVEKSSQYNPNPGSQNQQLRPYNGPNNAANIAGYIIYLLFAIPILMPVQLWALFVTWMGIVSIPMAKVNLEVFRMIFRRPLHIEIEADYRGAQRHHVILCTHQAFSTSYFSYRIWGMNVAIVNFFPIIVIAVIESYVMPEQYSLPPVAKFFVDLVCSVPIKFYIGMGISSISAQTNYMVGALLSATFGSITELILYGAAIRAGGLEKMVTYAVTGSILCDLLLLPGLSMIVGGFKFKDQKFNSVAAGVGSIMLFISVVGSFTPTIFYHNYGGYYQHCRECEIFPTNNTINVIPGNVTESKLHHELLCSGCVFLQLRFDEDPMYVDAARKLIYFVAGVMPVAYIIGLLFTFRTHSHIFDGANKDKNDGDAEFADEADATVPAWSIPFSCMLMLVATLLYALIAENVVSELKPTIHALNIKQEYMGLTLIALVPAVTEIINAIKFALSGQITLSLQTGSSSAVQIALIQMPVLVFMSLIANHGRTAGSFVLIFPIITVFVVLAAVLTFNYIAAEGRTNYFKGTALISIYLITIFAFYFVPNQDPFKDRLAPVAPPMEGVASPFAPPTTP